MRSRNFWGEGGKGDFLNDGIPYSKLKFFVFAYIQAISQHAIFSGILANFTKVVIHLTMLMYLIWLSISHVIRIINQAKNIEHWNISVQASSCPAPGQSTLILTYTASANKDFANSN